MQLNLSTTKTTKGGLKPLQMNNHKTTINNTIFNIVTKGLYIRPIEAIVREICTNALDGHIVKGNPEQPFEVTLPTQITPYFIVRDFGCSMTNETVFDVYAVLGESTKNLTSTSIGGWGVGGKSPAAYTDTFFITTYLNNVKRVYQSSCLAGSTPLELHIETSTEEPDGVEVKIPIKREDCSKFINAVKTQLAPFDVKPIITNKDYFSTDIEYSYNLQGSYSFDVFPSILVPNKLKELKRKTVKASVYTGINEKFLSVRMGCVVYPLNVTSDFYEENISNFKKIAELSGLSSFLVDLPVDSVDIKPSREDLEYNDRTKNVLSQILNSLLKKYKKQLLTVVYKARNMPTLEAANYLKNNLKNEKVLNYAIKNYKTKCFSDTDKKIYYNLLPSSFNSGIKKELTKTSKETLVNPDFIVTNGKQAKTLKKFLTEFHFSDESKIVIYVKTASYIKKIDYFNCSGSLEYSGLFDRATINEYRNNPYFELKKGLFYGNKSKLFLVLTQDQINAYKPVFEKFYKEVEVVHLKDIPKSEKTNSSYYPKTIQKISTVVFKQELDLFYDQNSKTHSFKSLNELKSSYEQSFKDPVYFACCSYISSSDGKFFSELSRLLKINIVCFKLPETFCLKIATSTKFNLLNLEQLKDNLLNTITNTQKQSIKNDFLQNEYRSRFFKVGYQQKDFIYICFRENILATLKNTFFKFLPDSLFKRCILYPEIANIYVSDIEKNRIRLKAKTLQKRVIKRVNLIYKNKSTFCLLNSYINDKTVLELFKLNFKDFTYE